MANGGAGNISNKFNVGDRVWFYKEDYREYFGIGTILDGPISSNIYTHIDDYKLGYWAVEEKYDAIKCIRQKCYIIQAEGKTYPTIAGLPKYLSPIINFNNFNQGFTTHGLTVEQMQDMARANGASEEEIEAIHHKTTYKHVAGGVVLVDTDFTIK